MSLLEDLYQTLTSGPSPNAAAKPKPLTAVKFPPLVPVVQRTSSSELNSVARKPQQTQATVGGTNTLLPLIYGTQRVGGRIFALKVRSSKLVIGVAWCHGEVDSIVSAQINDATIPAGITATHYTGTAGQTTDATLAAAITGYADALPYVCYSVFDIPAKLITGFPRFAAKIKGMKISSASGGAKAYSENPAYIIADFIENTTYGMGRSVDWTSVATLAATCSATVGGEAKRLLSLVMETSLPGEQWLQTLRDYASCFVVPEGGSYRLVPDATGSSVYSFTSANIVAESLRLKKRGASEVPTMVEVIYTDNTVTPYREARYSTAAVSPRRVSRINKPGITRHSEAVRYAIERLNEATLCDLSAQFEAFDAALALQVGDLIDITHPIGLSAKVMRISRIDPVSAGRWRIDAVEYDPAVYDSSVATTPTTPDTSTPSASDLTVAVSNITFEEIRDQFVAGMWTTRLKITWDAPSNWPYVNGYNVLFGAYSIVLENATVSTAEYISPPLDQAAQCAVSVTPISVTGTWGAATIDSHVVTSYTGVGIGEDAATPPAALSVATAAAKATAATTTATTIGTANTAGTSDLALNIRLGGSATQSARWSGVQSYENGYGAQTLVLQDLGGPVVIGATSAPSGTILKVIGGSINLDEEVRNRAIGFNVDTTFSNDGSTVAHYGLTYQPSSVSYGVGLSGYGELSLFTAGVQRALFDNAGLATFAVKMAWQFLTKSGAPTTSDIAAGYCGVWKDTGAGTVYLYVNDGGTLKKVQLT